MPGDLLDLLQRVRLLLDRFPVPAAVVGGAALAVRARVRPTRDVDVVLAIPDGTTDRLLELATALGLHHDPRDRQTLIADGLIRLWVVPPAAGTDLAHVGGVDLIAASDPFMAEVVRRAESMDFGQVSLPVATPEDLILMKLEANRPHDLDDALDLKDAHLARLDRAYLEIWAHRLDVATRLQALLDPPAPLD